MEPQLEALKATGLRFLRRASAATHPTSIMQPGTVQQHRVVIVGGGFGGLYAAQALKPADIALTLIDRRNFHLFQPLLYQVATGSLSPGEIASPLRYVLGQQKRQTFLGDVVDIDPAARELHLKDGSRTPYDTLIVATGATHHYFGHPEWAKYAPGLKTVEDATEIGTRIRLAFERAEREIDPETRRALLTFVVVGAGPRVWNWPERWGRFPGTRCAPSSERSIRRRRTSF